MTAHAHVWVWCVNRHNLLVCKCPCGTYAPGTNPISPLAVKR